MKKILLFIAIISSFNVFAQATIGGSGASINLADQNNLRTLGFSFKQGDALRNTEGSYYLFNNWENNCTVVTSDQQKLRIKNVNLNLERHTFEAKIKGDSLFTFNFNNIDKFVVNGRTFKNYYWKDDNQVYEVIYESDEFQVLKGYRVLFVPASHDPMVKRPFDKYTRKETYFLRRENEITPFKLKKSKVLKLFDKSEVGEIEAYAEQQDLSYKKEKDIQKIFKYSERY